MQQPTIPENPLLTFQDAMQYLRVSRSTLYRLMWSGQLEGFKVGSTWRFRREHLLACIESRPIEAPPSIYQQLKKTIAPQ
jgi:excisionase family DNA binding protein